MKIQKIILSLVVSIFSIYSSWAVSAADNCRNTVSIYNYNNLSSTQIDLVFNVSETIHNKYLANSMEFQLSKLNRFSILIDNYISDVSWLNTYQKSMLNLLWDTFDCKRSYIWQRIAASVANVEYIELETTTTPAPSDEPVAWEDVWDSELIDEEREETTITTTTWTETTTIVIPEATTPTIRRAWSCKQYWKTRFFVDDFKKLSWTQLCQYWDPEIIDAEWTWWYYNWTCSWNLSTVKCTALLNLPSSCWTALWVKALDKPISNLCAEWKASSVLLSKWNWIWSCSNTYSTTKVSCLAKADVINGECWPLANFALPSKPATTNTNLCKAWTVLTDGNKYTKWGLENNISSSSWIFYNWFCFWINGWKWKSCYAWMKYTSFYYSLKSWKLPSYTYNWVKNANPGYAQQEEKLKYSTNYWYFLKCDAWYTMYDNWKCIKTSVLTTNLKKMSDPYCEKDTNMYNKAKSVCSWQWLKFYACEVDLLNSNAYRVVWSNASGVYAAKCKNTNCGLWLKANYVYFSSKIMTTVKNEYWTVFVDPQKSAWSGTSYNFTWVWSWTLPLKVYCEK